MKKNSSKYTNRFKNNSLVNYYETIEYANDSYYSLMWKLEQDYLLKLLGSIDSKKMHYLDFACGTGRVCGVVEKYVASSSGIDVSSEMLKVAQKKTSRTTLIKQDIVKRPLKKKFDLITAFRFFLNAEESLRNEVLASLKKSLKKNSILVFNIHGNKYSFRFLVFVINKLLGKKTNQMSYAEVKYLLEKNGYEIMGYTGVGFIPKIFYRVPILKNLTFRIDKHLYTKQYLRFFSPILIFSARLK